MKKTIATLALAALATTVQAVSVQEITTIAMPVKPGKFQLDVTSDNKTFTTGYDSSGKSHSLESDIGVTRVNTGIAIGIVKGLELNLRLPYGFISYKDFYDEQQDKNGFLRPAIGAKYGFTDLGLALFFNWSLPFGSEDMIGENPVSYFSTGIMVDKTIGSMFQLRGALAYHFIPENDDKYDAGDVVSLDFVPGIYIIEGLAIELPMTLAIAGSYTDDGETRDNSDSHEVTIGPGVRWQINETVELELETPFTVMAKNAYGGWGANLEGKFTF